MEVNSVKIARDEALKNSKKIIVKDQANNYYIGNGEKDLIIWLDDEATMIHISTSDDFYTNTKYRYMITTVSYVDILNIKGYSNTSDVASIINKYKSKITEDEYNRAKSTYNF